MKYYFYIIFTLFSFAITQNTELKISDITVQGNSIMLEQDIINFSGLSPDTYINAIEIQNAINRLWLLNRFKNIQIDLEETNYGINNLIIKIEEYANLNEIIFEGDYFDFELFKFKKSKSELQKISELESGTVLSNQRINKALNLIKEDFIKRNFHDVTISYKLRDIDFNINKKKYCI